jgi:hypothetical protein
MIVAEVEEGRAELNRRRARREGEGSPVGQRRRRRCRRRWGPKEALQEGPRPGVEEDATPMRKRMSRCP